MARIIARRQEGVGVRVGEGDDEGDGEGSAVYFFDTALPLIMSTAIAP